MIRLQPRASDGVAEPRLRSLDPGRASERLPPAARLPCSRCQGGARRIWYPYYYFFFFFFRLQQPHVLMSNPCGAVRQTTAPYHFAINRTNWGDCLNEIGPIGYEAAHAHAERLFRQLLPACGLTVREGQIKLCHAMIDALYNKEVALCDAGVGLGKTYAYLLACILWQLQRPRPLRSPVVISTASVALQDAILQEYIPFLSCALIQNGYIDAPIRAVLRKGKERFACDLRLQERRLQIAQRGEQFAHRAALLREAGRCLDLDHVAGLSRYDRRHICVPTHCDRRCAERESCRYQQYLRESNGPTITIQVCNHNYLLADALHRQNGWKPLLRDYQALVVDEAHRLPEAAQQMATCRLSTQGLAQLAQQLSGLHLTRAAQQVTACARALAGVYAPQQNEANAGHGDLPPVQVPFTVTKDGTLALAALQKTLAEIQDTYRVRLTLPLLHQLKEMRTRAAAFAQPDDTTVCYVEYSGIKSGPGLSHLSLCAVPRDLPRQLYDLLWRQEKPAVLTSGTLAAGGDFAPARRQLGLEGGTPVRTLQVPSPFDYPHNSLLVFPPPSPGRQKKKTSHERVARQIGQLICAAHGHTLVLFTSYDQMGHVYEQLEGRLPVPLFKAPRGGQRFVEQFKQCPNAVLLAGGPCWEGVDFPGDGVSLLVIVRLPFPVPDPVREARREQYPDLHTYIQAEIVPEMQQKLRQGFGRAIRTETDSCAVAILDPRAAPGGRYHRAVLDALPAGIPITTNIEDIQTFLRARKSPDFFLPDFENDSKQSDSKTNTK